MDKLIAAKGSSEASHRFTNYFLRSMAAKVGAVLATRNRNRTVDLSTKSMKNVWSPVFPVSDDGGYEVVGSFQYGRGVSIDGDEWDSLRKQDPFSVLDQKTATDVVNAILKGKSVTVEVEKTLPGGTVVRESKTLNAGAARSVLEKKVLRMLRKNYSDADLIDLGLLENSSKDPNRFTFNFQNIIANRNDSVHKLPVVNAGLSLADLSLKQDGKVCECRAAEASVQLEAFGNEGFLQFSGDSNDRAVKWLQQQAHFASSEHRVQQNTLRGTALEPPNNSKFMSLNDLKKGLSDSFVEPIETAKKRFQETKEQWKRFEEDAGRRFRQAKQDVAAEFDGNPRTNAGDPLPEDREDG